MLTHTEIAKIEKEQARQYRTRQTAFNVINKFAPSHKPLASKIASGEELSIGEVDFVFDVAMEHHPIPSDKAEYVIWALSNNLEFRHFNPFGQELK